MGWWWVRWWYEPNTIRNLIIDNLKTDWSRRSSRRQRSRWSGCLCKALDCPFESVKHKALSTTVYLQRFQEALLIPIKTWKLIGSHILNSTHFCMCKTNHARHCRTKALSGDTAMPELLGQGIDWDMTSGQNSSLSCCCFTPCQLVWSSQGEDFRHRP